MRVIKALNNNMVLAHDEQGNDCICQGKGIGWGKKKDDILDECLIERRFIPANADESNYFQQLFSEIPEEFWKIAEDVVNYGSEQYGIQVSQKIILPLCDHMAGSVERYRDGICLDNPMLWDIKRIYPREFKVGKYALELLRERYGIEMREDEAGFLAYHFVNAELENRDSGAADTATLLISHVMDIVEDDLQITLNEEELSYQRFLTHLKFFAQKIIGHQIDEDPGDDILFDNLKKSYPEVYRCMNRIADYILTAFQYDIGQEERIYLMFHIQRVTHRIIRNNN